MSDAPLSILLVEADDVTQQLYARELSRRYRVFTCRDEVDALRFLRTEDIRAIILEPALADGLGWRLLASIRHMQPGADIPIVLCSAVDERRKGMDLGAAAYLIKPVLPVTLRNTLDQILRD